MSGINLTAVLGKLHPKPKRPKQTVSPSNPPRSARHANLNITALRKRRAKNKVASASRRINRGAK